MPPDGYESITLPEELIERLESLRYEGTNSNEPNYSYAEVIRRLLARPRANSNAGGNYDGSAGEVKVVRMDQGVINDIAGATTGSLMDELEGALR